MFLDQAKEPHRSRYIKFIDSRAGRVLSVSDPKDDHHIQPRSLGGTDTLENRIVLSAREHMIAHMMLWKAVGGKMTNAFHFMARGMTRMSRAWVHIPFSIYNAVIQAQREELSRDNHQTGKKRTDETKRIMSKNRLGKIHMTDGVNFRLVTEEKALDLIDQGWTFGMGDRVSQERQVRVAKAKTNGTFKSHDGSSTRGKTGVTINGKKQYVDPDKVPAEAKPMIGPNAGLIPITKNGKSRRVKLDLVEQFLTEGWVRGVAKRETATTDEYREKKSQEMMGRIWVKKDQTQMRITPDMLDDAISSGWVKGRLPSAKLTASRLANLEKARENKGPVTEETKAKMSAGQKKRFGDPVARELLSLSKMGIPMHPDTRKALHRANTGRTWSTEEREKRSKKKTILE